MLLSYKIKRTYNGVTVPILLRVSQPWATVNYAQGSITVARGDISLPVKMTEFYNSFVTGSGDFSNLNTWICDSDTIKQELINCGFTTVVKASEFCPAGTIFTIGPDRIIEVLQSGSGYIFVYKLNGTEAFRIGFQPGTSKAFSFPFCSDFYASRNEGKSFTYSNVLYFNTGYNRWEAGYDNCPNKTNISVSQYDAASQFWYGITPFDEDDPYPNIPSSEPSDPAEGSGIPDSDPIDIPAAPTVSVTDTGFVGLFNPTLTQVQDLADYMWTGLFDINTFRKIFADPMDCILGFNMVPVDVPSGSPAAVRVGNISTGVSMNVATSQWVEVDCGSLAIDLPYGSYLDYAPYSKFSLYLPYIGTVELSTDDVVGKTLSLKYHVDILSCSCVAFLKCGDSVLYQFTGSCGYSIPLTGDNFRQMISNIIGIAATVAGVVATGGAAAPAAAGTMTAKQAARAAAKQAARTASMIGASESVAQNVMGSKPEVHRSGAIGSSAGIMGLQTPYLIMELPHACKPEKQYHYLGYPGFITTAIGDISGYAEFESVILDGIACTEDERGIIESYCSGGIYV